MTTKITQGSIQGAQRHIRKTRIKQAWIASILSKVATAAVQLIAVPIAYRALGANGYAAYAAVTATASVMSILNMGIGGSLVTPVAFAASRQERATEAELVQAGLYPLLLLFLVGALFVAPLIWFLPLNLLLGKVSEYGVSDLRVALVIASSGALLLLPLSATDVLRQAYQETHITYRYAAASNLLLGAILIALGRLTSSLWIFVAVFVGLPVLFKIANCFSLLKARAYLLKRSGPYCWAQSRALLRDGIRYVAASLSHLLVYQWPIYYIARVGGAVEAASYSVWVQMALLPITMTFSMIQPLWGSITDAISAGDTQWVAGQIRRARICVLLFGLVAIIGNTLFGQIALALWLRRPMAFPASIRMLMGMYVASAVWEYLHFVILLGVDRLPVSTRIVLQRALVFAVSVPILLRIGGNGAIWLGLCASTFGWSCWRLAQEVDDVLNAPKWERRPMSVHSET